MAKEKTSTGSVEMKPDAATQAKAQEPAVMAAGASGENKEIGEAKEKVQAAEAAAAPDKGKGDADAPATNTDQAKDKAAEVPATAPAEGFRNQSGRFTGNPPTDSERLDAIVDLLERNGMSLPKVLHRAKE